MNYTKILEGVWVLEGIASTEYYPSVTFTTRVDTYFMYLGAEQRFQITPVILRLTLACEVSLACAVEAIKPGGNVWDFTHDHSN